MPSCPTHHSVHTNTKKRTGRPRSRAYTAIRPKTKIYSIFSTQGWLCSICAGSCGGPGLPRTRNRTWKLVLPSACTAPVHSSSARRGQSQSYRSRQDTRAPAHRARTRSTSRALHHNQPVLRVRRRRRVRLYPIALQTVRGGVCPTVPRRLHWSNGYPMKELVTVYSFCTAVYTACRS